MCLLYLFLLLVVSTHAIPVPKDEATKILAKASLATKQSIASITEKWEIKMFPAILKNCFMPKASLDFMRSKFEQKIMKYLTTGTPQKFIMSFTGSSVTAGHDSPFENSYPVLIENILKPAFHHLQINPISRNLAFGNNPCIPYNPCVKYFSGYDADLVLWEQSYNCRMEHSAVEQFVRQSLTIESQPVVVVTDSATGTWKPSQCGGKNPNSSVPITPAEASLLKTDFLTLVSSTNKNGFDSKFHSLLNFFNLYPGAGIQTFHFSISSHYECKGPYIPLWQKGAAPWHPSVSGHKYRAAVHSYFWLHVWLEAINNIESRLQRKSIKDYENIVNLQMKTFKQSLSKASRVSPFPDNIVCKTDYEPRIVREASLKNQVVSGLKPNTSTSSSGWQFSLYEELINQRTAKEHLQRSHKDLKYLIHGNEQSGPLSLKVEMKNPGPLFICQTPGIWGKLPNNYVDMWVTKMEAFITYDVQKSQNFEFHEGKSEKLEIYWSKQELQLCVQLKSKSWLGKNVKAGKHVLTIVPKGSEGIIIAWMLTA